jgi:hypothetical protein
MTQDPTFEQIARDPDTAFDLLAAKFLAEKQYARLFETRLMRRRQQLGLPLIHNGGLDEIPAGQRPAYEEAFINAARETGGLFLADGDIPRAWSYFRAIGEPAPVVEAIERAVIGDDAQALIEIAFHEGVHPVKGFALVLEHFGTCRAITYFQQFPRGPGRGESLHLLVRTIHRELLESLRRTIVQNEGQAPAATRARELIAGRDWLFGEFSYYVDTSHVLAILGFSLELEDREMLELALDLAEYGQRLSAQFHYRGEPPFEGYQDYIVYLGALLGRDVDAAVAHFRQKAAVGEPGDTASAQVAIKLLVKLGRYPEAIAASLEYLSDGDPALFQMCQTAGDFEQLAKLARERDDLLAFTAATVQERWRKLPQREAAPPIGQPELEL